MWLCRPDAAVDPCRTDLTTTVVTATGARRVVHPTLPQRPAATCFYVYPTVSRDPARNADLTVDPEERAVAAAQAAPFSRVCRVWAPLYRQRTLGGLFNVTDSAPGSRANQIAFASVRAAWQEFLDHHDDGSPIVFIGHSQGAAMLIRLLRAEVDPDPTLRRRTAVAILLGANVTVRTGSVMDGSFRHLPLCTRLGERSCVIAYSTFSAPPPPGALFGRAGLGVSALSGETQTLDRRVACVNPAHIATRAAPLHPLVRAAQAPSEKVATPWLALPGRYTAQCKSGAGATWLQVTAARHDPRPTLPERLGQLWGLHDLDVSVALDDLVADVAAAVKR